MGACASFPKGKKDVEAREAQLPEQSKDVDPTPALTADVTETDKEVIKLADEEEKKEQGGDDNKANEDEEKAIESSNKEGEITEATKTTPTEEQSTFLASDAKVDQIATTVVVPVTKDDNKETTEFKDEK